MEKQEKQPSFCANCSAELLGKFCHKCGEKKLNRKDFAISNFLEEVFEKFTHLDSKLFRTLKWLVIRPGFLTVEYLRGRRKAYLKPLSLFFIINLLYFLTIGYNGLRTFETPLEVQLRNPYRPIVEKMLANRFPNAAEAEIRSFAVQFDLQNHTLAKSMLLLTVPMLAAVLWLLYRRRGLYFGEHLIAALHFQALMLVQNMVLGIFFAGGLTNLFFSDAPGSIFIIEIGEPLLWVFLLAFFTLKCVYAERTGLVLVKSLALAFCWMPILILYRFVVFLASFYSI